MCIHTSNAFSQECEVSPVSNLQQVTSEFSFTSGKMEHAHNGLYASLGLGYTSGTATGEVTGVLYTGAKAKLSGNGIALDARLGKALSPNWVAHFILLYSRVEGPKFGYTSMTNETLPDATLPNSVTFSEAMFGGGFTYYIMPANAYISGSLGVGGFSLKFGESKQYNADQIPDVETDFGFAYNLKVGWEFWMDKDYALGVNASYLNTYSSAGDNYDAEDWNSERWTFGVNLTYN